MRISELKISTYKNEVEKHNNRTYNTIGGSNMIQRVLDMENTSIQCSARVYLKALVMICFGSLFTALLSTNPAQASSVISERVDFSRAMPEERVEDMRVKVLGGTISVDRFYRVMRRGRVQEGYPGVSGDVQGDKGNTIPTRTGAFGTTVVNKTHYIPVWQFHRKWHDLLFNRPQLPVGASVGGDPDALLPPQVIDRNDYLYQRVPNKNYYVYEHNGNDLRITITDYGFRWSNREGDWIDYDQDGLAVRSGDKNGVTITIIRDGSPVEFAGTVIGGLITEYRDHLNRTIVKWEYQDRKPVKVTDYTGRSVQYTWNEHELVEVTTTRGHKWRYQYESFGENRFLTAKTDPEDQKFTYSYAESKGGFQKVTPPRVNFSGVTIVGDNSAAAAGLGLSSSDFDLDVTRSIHSIAVQRTWMHTGMVYPDGKRVTYEYQYDPNSRSYMIFSKNSDGVESERWYDLDGQLRYNFIGGRVAGVRVRSGSTAVSRDAYGQRTITKLTRHEAIESISFADGTEVSYKYLPNYNFPVLETDQTGIETKHGYDFKGNLVKTTYGFNTDDQRVVEYDYDAFGQVTAIRYVGRGDTPTTEVKYEYDNYGNLIKITDAKGNITQFKDYNSQGQYQTLIDGRAKSWKVDYDENGNPLTTTTPLGFASIYEYDSLHRLKKYTDAELRKTEFEYDSRNFNIKVTNNEGGEQNVKRRMDGLVTETVDESGQVTSYQYDRAARLTSVVDGVGNESQIFYDRQEEVAGRRISQIITPNRTTRLVYDPLYRLVQQTDINTLDDQITRSTRYGYSARGERTSYTDENGNITRWAYTPHGEYQTVTNALNEVITSAYDTRGNLISVTDPLEKVYRFEYDANDNLTSEFRPMGEKRGFTYNANDDQVTFTDYNGNVAVYKYDNDSRLVEQANTKVGATTPERIVAYTFDKSELIKSVTDQNTATTYEYDPVGRLKQQNTTFFTGGLPFTKVLKNAYYKNGQIKTRTDAEGSNTTFSYDEAGKFKQMAIQGAGSIVANAYEGDLIKSMTYPGGISRSYEYDGFARPNRIAVADNAGNLKMDLRYKRDLVGNVLEKTSLEGTFKFEYDRVYRLTSAEQPDVFGNQTFSYDKVGNRTRQTIGDQLLSYNYNENHEMTQIEKTVGDTVTDQTFSYDNNGAQVSGTIGLNTSNESQFAYNGHGRLVSIAEDDQNIAEYKYDAMRRRSSKSVSGIETYFLYDETGIGLAGEYNSSGELIRGYSYNSASYFTTNPVSVKSKENEQVQRGFYQNDFLGTPKLVLGNSGAVKWKGQQDAFGTTNSLVNEIANPLRFAGQYHDVESGLAQNWNRYYVPSTGRYFSSDPIGLNGGIHHYVYAFGNPYRFVDPMGLEFFDPVFKLVHDGTGWEPDQSTVDAAAGFGDGLTLGATKSIRELADIGSVDYCSSAYNTGSNASIFFGGVTSFGSKALNRLARNSGDRARNHFNGVRDKLRRKHNIPSYGRGDPRQLSLHHSNPLKGHPGGLPTLYPTAGLPSWIANGRWNTHSWRSLWTKPQFLTRDQHTKAHRRLRKIENYFKPLADPRYPTAQLASDRVRNNCECN